LASFVVPSGSEGVGSVVEDMVTKSVRLYVRLG
jgi:hypothetical protein